MNRLRQGILIIVALAAILGVPGMGVGAGIRMAMANEGLPRIVSLDHCSDQYALALADPSQIAALSPKAHQDYSFFADRAKGIPSFRGTVEEILQLDPDYVIRYWGGDKSMLNILEQAGIKVISAKTGLNMTDMLSNVDVFSAAFKQKELGLVFREDYKARLLALERTKSRGLNAIYLTPSGTTAGAGTFANDILRLAGFSNAIAEMGLKRWPTIPLEKVILDPPDVFIGAFFDNASIHHSDWGILRHNAVQRMFEDVPTVYVPGRLLACRTFTFVDAAEYIVHELEAINFKNKDTEAPL